MVRQLTFLAALAAAATSAFSGCAEQAPGSADAGTSPPIATDASWQPTLDATGGGSTNEFGPSPTPGVDAAVTPDASVLPAPSDAALDPASLVADGGGAGTVSVAIVDGKTVTIYRPVGADAKKPLPVVLSLHGLSIPAVAMADITGLPKVADTEGFVAVFPDGSGGTWNTGGSICGLGGFVSGGSDDVAYMQNILKEVEKTQAVDHGHVFVSGFSMGGYGTNNLACLRPDLFRAAAPASGGFPTEACAPAVIPVMIFHGTSDGTIDYSCGKGARDAWVAHNHCSTEVDTMMIQNGKCEWNRGCPEHGQVVLCSFTGMGHGWAGSVDPFAFGGPQFESATGLMWKFFKAQF